VLRDSSLLLREGANMLSVVLQPAVSVALHSKARNAYSIPTMVVSAASAGGACHAALSLRHCDAGCLAFHLTNLFESLKKCWELQA
jgi:hypothetical protein